ncbi:MAG: AAA domain-containing protein, partial [Flavobacteriales bacterium]
QWSVDVMSDAGAYTRHREERIASLGRDIQVLRKQEMLIKDLIPLQTVHDEWMLEGSFVRWFKRISNKTRRKHHQLFGQLNRWNSGAADILDFRFEHESICKRMQIQTTQLQAIESFNLQPESVLACTADFQFMLTNGWLPFIDDLLQMLQAESPASSWEKSVYKVMLERKKARMQSAFAWEEMKELMVWLSEQRTAGSERVHSYYQRNVQREIKRAERAYGMRRLYNLRGGRGQERNSLRQIVQSDPDLFLSIFPVTLCTPEVASILFRGARGMFDLVIFDEASQIRVEDAFTGLLKGNTVVIAGDRHQMPPSFCF